MRITNEHQHVQLGLSGGRTAEGIVQVRGFDLTVRGRGVVVESRRPVAVVVRTPHTVRRVAIDESHALRTLMAYAAPVAAYTLWRLRSRRRGRT